MAAAGAKSWWGSFRIAQQGCGRWRVGPLTLCIQRVPGEWRLATSRDTDPLFDALEIEVPCETRCEGWDERFGLADDTDDTLRVMPALADRAVIARPEEPFTLPAGEELTIFVGTPLWFRLETGKGRLLTEHPIFRPSDTFFGPSTMEGELCYAGRTFCRLHLQEVMVRPHRATTAVRIRNASDQPLPLERLKVPAPHLALYQDPERRLWTQDVLYERRAFDQIATVTFGSGAPRAATDPVLLVPPRLPPPDNVMMRAFASLLRLGFGHG